ncbi:hypothetical protein GGF38_004054, partial [Coemansia sp. RSA 25]
GGFSLYTRTVNMGLYAAGEYVRLIDALFGSTDTSRVLASFMHMCRREAFEKNPEIRALVDEHGVVGFGSQVLKTIVAWICLQVVTHGRSRPYRMELVYSNVQAGASAFCPRKFIDSSGRPLPAAAQAAAPSRRRTPDAGTPMTPPAPSDKGDEDEGDAYYALSDQEGTSHMDPDWDQRLMEALRKLSLRNEQHAQSQSQSQGQNQGLNQSQGQSQSQNPNPNQQSSLWSTLLMVRESAAILAQGAGSDGSSSDSDPCSVRHGRRMSAPFESAPASLVSSPQHPATPGLRGRTPRRWSSTEVPALGGQAAAAAHESRWLQQEFPRKPLLFNLARFIPVASSAYGHSFMRVLGLAHGMVDARALIAEFGDYEVGISQSASSASIADQSAARLPRAQPMSSYHTHSAYRAARPDSQRQYERRHFRAASPCTPSRRPPPVRRHRRRRPVSEHPNHFCFAQHTGIPLGDLLFSSYVPPIVPGVSNAASAQAEA